MSRKSNVQADEWLVDEGKKKFSYWIILMQEFAAVGLHDDVNEPTIRFVEGNEDTTGKG
jgi:hypothetical protein